MRKSSFNLQPATPGCFWHNSREVAPTYLIDSIHRNSFNRSAEEAQAYYNTLLSEATKNYIERTGQSLQVKQEKLLWEAVVVLDYFHTQEDVEKLAKYFEKKYGWQPIQIAIHRDEGYVEELTSKIVYNYHAHIVFLMLNKAGIYMFKKRDFGKKVMSELQTEVAKILKMPRGESKLTTGNEHFSPKQYRKIAQEIESLKIDNIQLRNENEMLIDLAFGAEAEKQKVIEDALQYKELVQTLKETVEGFIGQITEPQKNSKIDEKKKPEITIPSIL